MVVNGKLVRMLTEALLFYT